MSRRLVVVTGGGGGIGRALAARFEGDDVVAPGREDCDVTEEESVAAFFAGVGDVDVLVNNAGVAESGAASRTSLASWRAHLAVNATGAFLCTRAVLPGMRERGRGAVVTVASTAGRVGAPLHRRLHRVQARRGRPDARRGGRGRRHRRDRERRLPDLRRHADDRALGGEHRRAHRARSRGRAHARRWSARRRSAGCSTADEVAAAVAWLASPRPAAINGQALVLDGGGIQA